MIKFLGAFLAAAVITLSGCTTTGNGVAQTRNYNNQGIDSLKISGPWQVNVICNAAENKCDITAEENLFDCFSISYGETLKAVINKKLEATMPLTITIATKSSIKSVELGGLSRVKISGANGKTFKAEMKDGSTLELDKCNFSEAEFELSQAAEVEAATTRIGEVEIEIAQAGRFSLGSAVEMEVELSGKSLIEVNEISGMAKGKLTDAAKFIYGGTGAINLRSEGTAIIRHKK